MASIMRARYFCASGCFALMDNVHCGPAWHCTGVVSEPDSRFESLVPRLAFGGGGGRGQKAETNFGAKYIILHALDNSAAGMLIFISLATVHHHCAAEDYISKSSVHVCVQYACNAIHTQCCTLD